MKPRLLLLACTVLALLFGSLSGPSRVQAAPPDLESPSGHSTFIQDVPADAWPFSAVDTLQKAGIVIGYSNGTYEGNHTLPRREFAVMVVRLMPLSPDTQAKLEKSPGALAALVALLSEFRPEIVRLFATVATPDNSLPIVEEQMRLLKSRQSRVSPVTPANITPHRNLYGIVGNNWSYIAMNTLHNAGVINYLGDGNGSRLLLDRYNFAFLIAHVLPLLSPSAGGDAGVATGGTPSDLKTDLDKARRDTVTKLTENPPALNALIALVDEFAPELKFLRQDVPVAQRRLQTMQTKVRQETYAGKRTLSLESASSPFADVPSQDIAFDCLDVLQGVGIPIRATDRPVVGKVPMTRLQCGTAIAGLMPFSLPRLVVYDGKRYTPLKVSLPQDLQSKLQQSPLALDALMTLVIEFTPELKLLGQDVALIQSSLRDVRQSAAQPIPGQAPRAAEEVPSDSWPYAALNAINKDGIPFGYDMGDNALKGQTARPVQSGLTRYEFAVSVARILPLVETPGTPLSPERPFYLPAALRDATLLVIDASRRDLESKMRHDTFLIDALRALLIEFRPELLQLNVDVSTPHMRLENIEAKIAADGEYSGPRRIKRRQNVPPRSVRAAPFLDVPPNHWAFSAVEALRQSGIVVGYPKGADRTDEGHE